MMKKFLAIAVLTLSASGVAHADTLTCKSFSACASALPNSTYKVDVYFNIKNHAYHLTNVNVFDLNAKKISQVPNGVLGFTKSVSGLFNSKTNSNFINKVISLPNSKYNAEITFSIDSNSYALKGVDLFDLNAKNTSQLPKNILNISRFISPLFFEQQDGHPLYEIRKGDSLSSISNAFYGNLSKEKSIAELNKIVNINNIYIGEKIKLPLV